MATYSPCHAVLQARIPSKSAGGRTPSNAADFISRRYVAPFICLYMSSHIHARPAAGLALLSAIALLPIFLSHRRHPPRWPYVLFALISTLAFLASAAALGVALYLFTITRDRFHAQQIEAAYGPSVRARPSQYSRPLLNADGIPLGALAMAVCCRHGRAPRCRSQCWLRNLCGRTLWTATSAPPLHVLSDDGDDRSRPKRPPLLRRMLPPWSRRCSFAVLLIYC